MNLKPIHAFVILQIQFYGIWYHFRNKYVSNFRAFQQIA